MMIESQFGLSNEDQGALEMSQNGTSKVLYIEDQPEMIDLVRLTLRRLGCEVYGATDGVQGLKMMRELQPDLVLLDLMLPGSDGWEIRNAMETDERLKGMPVVLVTARVQDETMPKGRKLPQADAYITKPFSLAEIRSAVQTVLSQRKKARVAA